MTELLPLSEERVVIPTGRDMLPSERRHLVRTHRTCVFGTNRRDDGPAMSIVCCIPTSDGELLGSTMAGRANAKTVERTGKASLCVLDENWPVGYLQVYCDAVVDTDTDLVVDVMAAVAGRMSGTPLGDDARPFVEAMAKDEERVVLRCTPYETFAQPPRHLHDNDQEEQISHWISSTMPWGQPDP